MNKKLLYKLFHVAQLIGLLLLIVWIVMTLVFVFKESVLGAALMFFLGWIPGLTLFFIAKGYKERHSARCGIDLAGCEYEYHTDSFKNDSAGNRMAKVIINAKCPDCDKVKTIKKNIRTYDAKKGIAYDLESKIEEFCQQTFKH